METECLPPHWQRPAICPWYGPDHLVHILQTDFFTSHFNIIIYFSQSPRGSHSLCSPHQNPVCTSLFPIPATYTAYLILLEYDHRNNIWWGVQIIKLFFMYILLHFSVTSSFLEPTIFLSTILSNTLSLCSCLCAWKNDSAPMILRVLWLQFVVDYKLIFYKMGARGSAVGWGTALKAGRSRVRYPIVSLKFFIDIILPTALWSWGSLSL